MQPDSLEQEMIQTTAEIPLHDRDKRIDIIEKETHESAVDITNPQILRRERAREAIAFQFQLGDADYDEISAFILGHYQRLASEKNKFGLAKMERIDIEMKYRLKIYDPMKHGPPRRFFNEVLNEGVGKINQGWDQIYEANVAGCIYSVVNKVTRLQKPEDLERMQNCTAYLLTLGIETQNFADRMSKFAYMKKKNILKMVHDWSIQHPCVPALGMISAACNILVRALWNYDPLAQESFDMILERELCAKINYLAERAEPRKKES